MVGGGNSAGQAAVFLARTAKRVFMLIRREGLADTMSRYLIRRIEDNPAIVLRTHTQIVGLEGDGHLERVQWRDDRAGNVETKDIRHVFMMTGAIPNTDWLERCVALDAKGFIKTGPTCRRTTWRRRDGLTRPPLLETSRPRPLPWATRGNFKRVALAVGEGSTRWRLFTKSFSRELSQRSPLLKREEPGSYLRRSGSARAFVIRSGQNPVLPQCSAGDVHPPAPVDPRRRLCVPPRSHGPSATVT